jgi:hypothetical protein
MLMSSVKVKGERMIEITQEKFMSALRDAVAEKGDDYVYSRLDGYVGTCLYVHDDEPGCIMGNALHRMGVSLDQLGDKEGEGITSVLEYLHNRGIIGDYPSLDLEKLSSIQAAQDCGSTWGKAVHG